MKLKDTHNDLRKPVRSLSVKLLNQQLVDALDLGLQTKKAHWNVKGAQFLSLHELFDNLAESLQGYSDLLAERAVQLGGIADGTVQDIGKETRLPVYAPDSNAGSNHVRTLLVAVAMFASSTRAAVKSATSGDDATTADILTEVSRGIDTFLWKLEAHLIES